MAALLPGKESFCEVGTEVLYAVYMNFSWKIQFVITEGWNVTGLRQEMRNHYRGHKMSLWLNLIPQLHRPGGDDLNMRHHHFQEEGAQFYEGETFWQRHSVISLQSVPPNLLHFSVHNVHWIFMCVIPVVWYTISMAIYVHGTYRQTQLFY